MYRQMLPTLALIALTGNAAAATATTTTTFSDRNSFEAALSGGFTTIDTSAYIGRLLHVIDDDFADAEFFGPITSYVRNDDLILNGAGFWGSTTPHVGLNFAAGVNGIGIQSNPGDGGVIRIYDGLDATGTLLGSVGFGANATALFGGIVSADLIRSAVFSCDYNSDLKCGLRDPVYGTTVPVPAAALLFVPALAGLAAFGRRRETAPAA